ncbi:hypothetical protein [Vibrio sp. D431a]|uniref:hypothetical protein n=1 Tax=Vibrio sp. D431a TaxID=2837388 RepID=UPI002554094C|nr:hypothetical protein [Vibrio sp. D431a]MDK9790047.1 hypothetical protein [Vibrio sp. D431a]
MRKHKYENLETNKKNSINKGYAIFVFLHCLCYTLSGGYLGFENQISLGVFKLCLCYLKFKVSRTLNVIALKIAVLSARISGDSFTLSKIKSDINREARERLEIKESNEISIVNY